MGNHQHCNQVQAVRGFITPRVALLSLLICVLAFALAYIIVTAALVKTPSVLPPLSNNQPLPNNSIEPDSQKQRQDKGSIQNTPANNEEIQEGCFDRRRFCFELTPTDNNAKQWQLTLVGKTDFPVAVTLYAQHLYSAQSHADSINKKSNLGAVERISHTNTFLTSQSAVMLGFVDDADAFWATMHVKWTPGVINAQHDSSFAYVSPLQPASKYRIVQGFNGAFSHSGASRYAIDFAAPVGTPVLAAREGTVIDTKADGNKGGSTPDYASHANYVVILHSDGTTGEYYHLRYQGVNVERGQHVQQGQLLGYSGNTGFSSLPHLHFGIYVAKYHGRYISVPFKFKDIKNN